MGVPADGGVLKVTVRAAQVGKIRCSPIFWTRPKT
jgi:hypothetical protein